MLLIEIVSSTGNRNEFPHLPSKQASSSEMLSDKLSLVIRPSISKPSYAQALKSVLSNPSPTISAKTHQSHLSLDSSQEYILPPSPSYTEEDIAQQKERDRQALEEALQEEQYRTWLLAHTMVETEASLQEFLSVVDKVAVDYEVDLFLDAEGGNGHGRNSNLNFIQVKSASLDKTWLLDVQVLGAKIFDTPSTTGKKRTLGQICEDEKIPKVFFDVRADSDSIYGHLNVHLKGVIDLQVMELATRQDSRVYLHGLDRCISKLPDNKLPRLAAQAWNGVKSIGKRYCTMAGGYGAFDERPIADELRDYAVNDATLMPILFTYYSSSKMLAEDEGLMRLVLKISADRVTRSISPEYGGNTRAHRFGPDEMRMLWPEYDSDGDLDDYYGWYS
jgi:exonuclease 3'-5' domain-containing protein 1